VTSRSVEEKNRESHRGSHRKDMSPLTQGLNYRSACDGEFVLVTNLGIVIAAFCQWCTESLEMADCCIFNKLHVFLHSQSINQSIRFISGKSAYVLRIYTKNKRIYIRGRNIKPNCSVSFLDAYAYQTNYCTNSDVSHSIFIYRKRQTEK